MSNRYVIEALLRPAVELNTAVVSGMAAYVCVQAPWAVALAPSVSYVTAAGFAALAVTRTHQGMKIIRYRRNLRRLPRYVMSTKQIPVSHRRLFLGRGSAGPRNTPSACRIRCARKWPATCSRTAFIRARVSLNC